MAVRRTLAEVARAAGVSVTAASLALNGKADRVGLATDTRRRIRDAARRLGYRCNPVARGLRTNRSGLLGVIMPDLSVSFCPEVLQGIEDAAVEANRGLLVRTCGRDPEREAACLAYLAEKRVDAVLLTSFLPDAAAEAIRATVRAGIPVVQVAGNAKTGLKLPFGLVDDEGVGRLAARHLLQLGHRAMACWPVTEGRLAGFRKTLREARVPLRDAWIIRPAATRLDAAQDQAARLLHEALRCGITAVFAGSDLHAAALLGEARERGVSVPGRLSVVGTDNLTFAAMTAPALTTVDLPKKAIGYETARRTIRWLDGVEPWKDQLFEGRLLVRGSCAPLAR